MAGGWRMDEWMTQEEWMSGWMGRMVDEWGG